MTRCHISVSMKFLSGNKSCWLYSGPVFLCLSWTQKLHDHEDWGDELEWKPRDLGSGPDSSPLTPLFIVVTSHIFSFSAQNESIVQMIRASDNGRIHSIGVNSMVCRESFQFLIFLFWESLQTQFWWEPGKLLGGDEIQHTSCLTSTQGWLLKHHGEKKSIFFLHLNFKLWSIKGFLKLFLKQNISNPFFLQQIHSPKYVKNKLLALEMFISCTYIHWRCAPVLDTLHQCPIVWTTHAWWGSPPLLLTGNSSFGFPSTTDRTPDRSLQWPDSESLQIPP